MKPSSSFMLRRECLWDLIYVQNMDFNFHLPLCPPLAVAKASFQSNGRNHVLPWSGAAVGFSHLMLFLKLLDAHIGVEFTLKLWNGVCSLCPCLFKLCGFFFFPILTFCISLLYNGLSMIRGITIKIPLNTPFPQTFKAVEELDYFLLPRHA